MAFLYYSLILHESKFSTRLELEKARRTSLHYKEWRKTGIRQIEWFFKQTVENVLENSRSTTAFILCWEKIGIIIILSSVHLFKSRGRFHALIQLIDNIPEFPMKHVKRCLKWVIIMENYVHSHKEHCFHPSFFHLWNKNVFHSNIGSFCSWLYSGFTDSRLGKGWK